MSKEAMTLALEALIDGDWYIEQLENVVYSSDDSGTHEVREKVKQTIKTLRLAIDAQNMASEPVVDFCRECLTYNGHHDGCSHAIKALEEALAKQEQGEPDKYVMDIECTKCGAKQSGILTVNTTPQPKQEQGEPVAWTIDSLEQEIYENTRQFVSLNVMEWLLNRLNSTLQPAPQRSEDTTQKKPLTDEEIGAILEGVNAYGTRLYTFARAIEAAHGIKS